MPRARRSASTAGAAGRASLIALFSSKSRSSALSGECRPHPAARALERELVARLAQGNGIAAAEAGVAVRLALALAGQQSLEREIAQRVHFEEAADALDVVCGGDEIAAARRVDAVEARMRDRRRADAEMNLGRPGPAQQAHQLAAPGAPPAPTRGARPPARPW